MDLRRMAAGEGPTPEDVREALKNVVDPELGVNIVDLGLVYAVEVEGTSVRVRMTLTAPACPMGEMIVEQVREEVSLAAPGVKEAHVDLVWDPPWNPEMMSAQARRTLGM